MKLCLELPIGCDAERRWVAQTLLGEFLGLEFHIRIVQGNEVRLTRADRSLTMPDIFFTDVRERWGVKHGLRLEPTRMWNVSQLHTPTNTVSEGLPVLFGDHNFEFSADHVRIPIDVFGSAFFLMSRYEEFVDDRRDQHERYCASFSRVGARAFLDRPLVNEYLEVLWSCLKYLWPDLERAARTGGTFVSTDVDVPYSPGNRNVLKLIRRLGGDVLRRRSFVEPFRTVASFCLTKAGSYALDPYFGWLNWLMTVNEKAGNRVQFYFIADRPAGAIDGCYRLDEPIIKKLMTEILTRGHGIGLHPSYQTFNDPKQMQRERTILSQALKELGAGFEVTQCRQHFLRWSVHETPRHQQAAGMTADATLGYADASGFRAGVCYPYRMFDLNERRALDIYQKPLVAMEVSVFGRDYMNVENHNAALDILMKLKQNCLQFNGDFRLLWHNNHLTTEADRLVYQQLISTNGG